MTVEELRLVEQLMDLKIEMALNDMFSKREFWQIMDDIRDLKKQLTSHPSE